jgi:glucokinase
MILAGDIGGTKCNLALYEFHTDGYRKIVHHHYGSREFASFDLLIEKFLSDTQNEIGSAGARSIEAAGFGVAGPVIEYRVKATNLPWVVDGAALTKQIATGHIVLMNDLEATGYSLSLLQPSELSTLNRGTPGPRSAQALIAAGTGLGEAFLFWSGDRYVVGSSEGGHSDFAPRTEREIELLRFMKRRNEFVSVELILSGRGFPTIHEFLDADVRHPSFDGHEDEAPAEITRLGLAGQCPVCVQTLEMWVGIYGAEAGNLALKVLARGGVWVAGGIAVKIRKKMEDGAFFRAFCEKEKFAAVLAQIPVYLVLNQEAPLLGAVAQASRAANPGRAIIFSN